MKVTKYEHACVVLEEQGNRLVIDPGEFTADFGPLDQIVAVVVTHNHPDHFHPEHLQAIIAANPTVVVYTTAEVAGEWRDPHAQAVHAYQDYTTGPFTLRFFGETHALIHDSLPRPQNTGLLVNETFYYPGDAFVEPDHHARVLAVPANAPWMKIGEAMDFIRELSPEICFPTHNAMLSERGQATADRLLGAAAESVRAQYRSLQAGESFEI